MSTSENTNPRGFGQFLVYSTDDGRAKIEVRLENETVWLTQQQMAELFQVGIPTINYHLKEIFGSGELVQDATIRKFRIVRKEGARDVARSLDFYNLDAIISVGYRVKKRGGYTIQDWGNAEAP